LAVLSPGRLTLWLSSLSSVALDGKCLMTRPMTRRPRWTVAGLLTSCTVSRMGSEGTIFALREGSIAVPPGSTGSSAHTLGLWVLPKYCMPRNFAPQVMSRLGTAGGDFERLSSLCTLTAAPPRRRFARRLNGGLGRRPTRSDRAGDAAAAGDAASRWRADLSAGWRQATLRIAHSYWPVLGTNAHPTLTEVISGSSNHCAPRLAIWLITRAPSCLGTISQAKCCAQAGPPPSPRAHCCAFDEALPGTAGRP
jgi:hypothetical protein